MTRSNTRRRRRREAKTYETETAAERRRLVRELLDPNPDATLLSVGCGPGVEPAELGASLADEGTVYGLDRSERMCSLARRRCGERRNVSVAAGDASTLPFETDTFDGAVAVQVYEYVEDPECAGELSGSLARERGDPTTGDVEVRATLSCDRCWVRTFTPPGVLLLEHPAVVSFFWDRGVDVRERPPWQHEWG